jgi:hypothetical protein
VSAQRSRGKRIAVKLKTLAYAALGWIAFRVLRLVAARRIRRALRAD